VSHVVFVESNTTGSGRLAVERLLASGDRVTFLTRSPAKYPFLAAAPGLEVVEVDTNRRDAVAASVTAVGRRRTIDALLTFSEFYVETVAALARHHGFPFLDPAVAARCRSKPATRRALRAAGLPTPDFHLVASEEEAAALAETLSYPVVVKPPGDSSSTGVLRVEDPEALLRQFRFLSSWRENVRGQPLSGEVLVESLLTGPEYSVETLTLPGGETRVLGVTDKHLSAPPHFVELGHDFPSAAPAGRRRALEESASAALSAVGYDFGPAHTEVRWTAEGPVVVEINPRLAGGMIPELIEFATGVDVLGAWLALLLGRPLDLQARRAGTASIRFLTASRAGTIVHIDDRSAEEPLVRAVHIGREVGAQVKPAEDTYDRLGFVITAGPDREETIRAADRARDLLRLEIDDGRGEVGRVASAGRPS
jgi:cysteine synthase A